MCNDDDNIKTRNTRFDQCVTLKKKKKNEDDHNDAVPHTDIISFVRYAYAVQPSGGGGGCDDDGLEYFSFPYYYYFLYWNISHTNS